MSFITYAQNNEDLVLYRALSEVQNGFYIDVGANDPSDDSVTKAFYDRGWRGINIEPLLSHWHDLERDRPEDINLRCAVGDHSGVMEIWEPEIRGWSTASVDVIAQHESDGLVGVTHSVPMRTLTEICQENGNREIHFLKIDVEGFERNVLLGMDFQKFRPWIIVVEAFDPVTKTENSKTWESLLTSAQYLFSYADGLNRFYVAKEHSELIRHMKYPPNVFDDFVRIRELVAVNRSIGLESNNIELNLRCQFLEKLTSDLEKKNSAALTENKTLVSRSVDLDALNGSLQRELAVQKEQVIDQAAKAHEWWSKALVLDENLRAMRKSWSWRLTSPLRLMQEFVVNPIGIFSKVINKLIAITINLFALPLSKLIGSVLGRRHFSERLNFRLQSKYPNLHSHLRSIAIKYGVLVVNGDEKKKRIPINSDALKECADLAFLGVYPKYPQKPQAMGLVAQELKEAKWIKLTGHLEGHYSLAIVNRNLAAALEVVNEERVKFIPYHGCLYEKIPSLPLDQEKMLGATLRRNISTWNPPDIVSITHHYPLLIDDAFVGLRACIFFWEETAVPLDIVAKLNNSCDGILVAAESVKKSLINSGCYVPIVVIPIGIDHLIKRDVEPVRVLTVNAGTRFRFLHVSSAFDRKGVDVLFDAFFEAFDGDTPVELFVKTFPNPHNNVHEQLKNLLAKHKNPPHVTIDEEPLNDAGMIDLYRTAHAVVLPTRGEGFNLPAAEALAMGIPVITTGYSAQIDFCTMATAELIAFNFSASQSHLRSDDACWVNPCKDDLIRALKTVREKVLAADLKLESVRRNARDYIRETYTWKNSANSILSCIDYFKSTKSEPNAPLHLIIVTPWKAQCGIAEYSEKLFEVIMTERQFSVDIYSDTRTKIADSNVNVSWEVGNTNSVISVLESIASSSKADVVIVQHQPSLFELTDELCERLERLQSDRKGVYLELHSTAPLLLEFRLSHQAVMSLTKLERIIVHKVEDLNNLLSLGIVENVVLVKLGVIQPLKHVDGAKVRELLEIPKSALVLGCFGFALPHKGLDAIIGALTLLAIEMERPTYMVAVCSALDERSANVIRECKALAKDFGVSERIKWITDYRQTTECQELLSCADYVVFPYKDTRESASGAVTIGLSTLKPVLVSPLNIFSDVKDVTYQMMGSQSVDICNAVIDYENKQSSERLERLNAQHQWLKVRDWHSVGNRLKSMIIALRRDFESRQSIASSINRDLKNPTINSGKNIYVDVSELHARDAKSGIQRVVRNILREIQNDPPEGYAIYPVFGVKKKGFFYTSKFDAPADAEEGAQLFVGVDDIFLGLDLAAHLFPEAESDLLEMKRAGAKVYYVIYDIIPLLNSEYAFPGIKGAFEDWMRGLNSFADGVLCISNAVAEDVNGWLRNNGGKRIGLKVNHFPLGADFVEMYNSTDRAPELLKIIPRVTNDVSFLMVGTLEPRKGYQQVLDAFDLLWDADILANLVIVGKVGWNVDSLVARLKSHKQLNSHLFWFDQLDDFSLAQLYGETSCLLAASYAEGFGLPLIEAAQYGKPIIARDIPIFREVAGDGAYFFSNIEGEGLSREILTWMKLFEMNIQPKSEVIKYCTWKQSSLSLIEDVLR